MPSGASKSGDPFTVLIASGQKPPLALHDDTRSTKGAHRLASS